MHEPEHDQSHQRDELHDREHGQRSHGLHRADDVDPGETREDDEQQRQSHASLVRRRPEIGNRIHQQVAVGGERHHAADVKKPPGLESHESAVGFAGITDGAAGPAEIAGQFRETQQYGQDEDCAENEDQRAVDAGQTRRLARRPEDSGADHAVDDQHPDTPGGQIPGQGFLVREIR